MAILEKGTAYKIPKKKDWWGDTGKIALNSVLSPFEGITGNNFYNPEMSTEKATKALEIGDTIGNIQGKLGVAALNLVPGAGPMISKGVSTVGESIGEALPPEKSNIIISKYGGNLYYKKGKRFLKYNNIPDRIENPEQSWELGGELTKYNGNSHENGGIPISQDNEVEDNETSFNTNSGDKYIFSDSILVPDKKHSFASASKKIESKYKKRLGSDDKLATTAFKRELEGLKEFQEGVKTAMNKNKSNKKFDLGVYLNTLYYDGGSVYDNLLQPNGNVLGLQYSQYYKDNYNPYTPPGNPVMDIEKYKPVVPYIAVEDELPLTSITPLKSKGYKMSNNMVLNKRDVTAPTNVSNNQDYTVPAIGYGVQALSNLPVLFSKPETVKYNRIQPELINLREQRNELRRNRNLRLAMAQRQAGQMDNIGQAGMYSNSVLSDTLGQYGDAYNQSFMTEQNTNIGLKNQAKLQNAEIQMREAEANQMEKDAVRSAKQQAIQNIGDIAAKAANTYNQMNEQSNQLNIADLLSEDYDFVYKNGRVVSIKRKKQKYGGRI